MFVPLIIAMTSFFAALRKAFVRSPSTGSGERSTAPVDAVATIVLRATAYSNTGPVRANNEDRVRCVLENSGELLGERVSLAIVADGMGGHQAGEVASETTVDVVADTWRARDVRADAGAVLKRAIETANTTVYRAAKTRADWEGMGTTVIILGITGDALYLAYVGDSRAYLLRDGMLQQLSEDDTLVNHLIRTGEISAEAAVNHPDRGVLSQALGTQSRVANIHVEPVFSMRAGDVYLLCSDGLHDVVADDVIAQTLATAAEVDLAQVAETLAALAVAAGTQDNISMVVLAAGVPTRVAGAARPTRLLNGTVT